MKRFIILLLGIALVFTACSSVEQSPSPEISLPQPSESVSTGKRPSVDVDLTTLSSTMVYAEVYNMMMSPDDYIGKIVRLKGTFTSYEDQETGAIRCGVFVKDAAACCAQGFDVIMPEDAVYPEDYPASDTEVTIIGELQIDQELQEYGFIFLQLENVIFE